MQSLHRRGGCCTQFPIFEQVEARTLLSDATLKIPVLNYHRVLPNGGSGPDYELEANITEDQFKAQLEALTARKFQSVTPRDYLAWVNGSPLIVGYDRHVLRPDEHAFMAVFDDANQTDLRAAELLKPYNFNAVAAVPTRLDPNCPVPDDTPYVGHTAQGSSTWAQIKRLASSEYGWEIASHSLYHVRMADGAHRDLDNPKPLNWFRNTPAELDFMLKTSREDIIDNAFDGDETQAPVAFFHPFHDLSRRSLLVASKYYPLAFGKAFDTGIADDPPQYIGKTTDLKNGELVRVAVANYTTIANFEQMLDQAAADTPFVEPIFVQRDIPVAYVATDGTIVIDGLNSDDTITLDASSVTLPAWNQTSNKFDSKTIRFTNIRVKQYKLPPGLQRIDLSGGRGSDTITVVASYNGKSPTTIDGDDGDDSISGGPNAEVLLGGAGNDTLRGGDGADQISGGNGNDLLRGDAQNDQIAGGKGNDRLYGYAGRDALSGGNGNDRLYGGPSADTLAGQDGNDQLFGEGGNDSLIGGNGSDTLDGAAGDDTFVSRDGVVDQLFGEDGTDRATADENDVLNSIEL